MNTISIDFREENKYMEELRQQLIRLIEIKGISSDEVIEASKNLDKLIVKYYQRRFSRIPNQSQRLFIRWQSHT